MAAHRGAVPGDVISQVDSILKAKHASPPIGERHVANKPSIGDVDLGTWSENLDGLPAVNKGKLGSLEDDPGYPA